MTKPMKIPAIAMSPKSSGESSRITSNVENQEIVLATRFAEACHSRDDATTRQVIGLCGEFSSAEVGCPDRLHADAPIRTLLPLPACYRDSDCGFPILVDSETTIPHLG